MVRGRPAQLVQARGEVVAGELRPVPGGCLGSRYFEPERVHFPKAPDCLALNMGCF